MDSSLEEDEKVLEINDGDGLHNSVNILKAKELCTLKWLKWSILCYVYFTTKIKKAHKCSQQY